MAKGPVLLFIHFQLRLLYRSSFFDVFFQAFLPLALSPIYAKCPFFLVARPILQCITFLSSLPGFRREHPTSSLSRTIPILFALVTLGSLAERRLSQ